MAAAALGTAANVTAVIGLADVVFRAGKDIFELVGKARSARKDIRDLLDEIRLLEEAVISVRCAADAFQTASPSVESRQYLDVLLRLLEQCDKLFREIRNDLVSRSTGASDGWFLSTRKNLSWVLAEKQVVLYCQKLERLKLSISMSLQSYTSNRVDAITVNVENIQSDVIDGFQNLTKINNKSSAVSSTALQGISDVVIDSHEELLAIKQEVMSARGSVETGFKDIKQGLSAHANDTGAQLRNFQATIKDTTSALISNAVVSRDSIGEAISRFQNSQNVEFSKLHDAGVRDTSKILESYAESSRQLKGVYSGIERLSRLAELSLSEKPGREVTINGSNLQSIVAPLLLVKPHLAAAFQALRQSGSTALSQIQTSWLHSELESLLAAGQRATVIQDGFKIYESQEANHYSQCQWADWSSTAAIAWYLGTRSGYAYIYDTPIGRLQLWLGSDDDLSTQNLKLSSSTRILFQFLPKVEFRLPALRLAIQQLRRGHNSSISRNLHTWNVIPNNSLAAEYARSGNASELMKLFESKQASPFDRIEDGRSLLQCHEGHEFWTNGTIERHGYRFDAQIELFKLFLVRGEGFEDDLLYFFKELWLFMCEAGLKVESFKMFLEVFRQSGIDEEQVRNVLEAGLMTEHIVTGQCRDWPPDREGTIQCAKSNGADLERRSIDGRTVLLIQAPMSDIRFGRALVNNGADVHAIDYHKQGFLHHLILSHVPVFFESDERPYYRGEFQERFCEMVDAGCNPNARNIQGISVSEYALHFGRSDLWEDFTDAILSLGLLIVVNDADYRCQGCSKVAHSDVDFPYCTQCTFELPFSYEGNGDVRKRFCPSCEQLLHVWDFDFAQDERAENFAPSSEFEKENAICEACGENGKWSQAELDEAAVRRARIRSGDATLWTDSDAASRKKFEKIPRVRMLVLRRDEIVGFEKEAGSSTCKKTSWDEGCDDTEMTEADGPMNEESCDMPFGQHEEDVEVYFEKHDENDYNEDGGENRNDIDEWNYDEDDQEHEFGHGIDPAKSERYSAVWPIPSSIFDELEAYVGRR